MRSFLFLSISVRIWKKKKDEEGKSYCDALNFLRCNSHHQCKNESPFWNFKFWLWAFFVFNNEKEKKQWRWRQQQRQKEVQFVIFSLFCFLLLSHKCMHLFSRHINVSGWVQTKWVFVIKMMYVSQSLRWIASHKKLLYNEFDVTFPFGCLISILWLVTALFFISFSFKISFVYAIIFSLFYLLHYGTLDLFAKHIGTLKKSACSYSFFSRLLNV